jgi:histone H3/H4
MSFDLDSSSSSEIGDANFAPRRIVQDSASEESDTNHSIDEELVESIRNALHLAVGNICREQDASTAAADDTDALDDTPSFTMSNSAIAALTDLTYHYSTTLLANDLVSFSSHAGRKIIKAEDVLLMSRKDKNGIGADLKRKMKELQDNINKERGKKSGKKSASPRRKSNSDRSTSPTVARKKITKVGKSSASKSKTNRSKNKAKRPVYSSSSDSGDEEDALEEMRQKVADLDRRKSSARDIGDLNDFIVNDNGYYKDQDSDSEIDFQFSTKKKGVNSAMKKKVTPKAKPKNALFNSSTSKKGQDVFRGLSDSDSSNVIVSKPKYKTIDVQRGAEGQTEDMAIDLGSGSD